MQKLIYVFAFVSFNIALAQGKNETLIHKSISIQTDEIADKLIRIRRDLYENPELAGKEIRTQDVIKKYLTDLGLNVRTDIYGHSIIGTLKGAKKGKSIAWRADMDALSIDSPDKSDLKSKVKGIRHSCGHDVHMAIALGIAEILSKNKRSLQGTVYFIFQPEEETFTGAKMMMENGLFSGKKPDEFYGLHVTALPVGQIMVKPNEIFAYQRRVQIVLKNNLPDKEITELTKNIEGALFRADPDSKPWEIQSIVDPEIGLANTNTIFKNYRINEKFINYTKDNQLFIEADLYETDKQNLKNIIPAIGQTIKANGYGNDLVSVSFIKENPTIINDPDLTNASIKTINDIYGKGSVTADYGQVPFFNDDFAYFQQETKGTYFLLGGSSFEKGIIAMNHSPGFAVDEECIRIAVKTFSSLIYERLK